MSKLSRMQQFQNKTFPDDKGQPKQGHEYRTLNNVYGYEEIGILLRWRDGRLHDDGDHPAVEFQDAHVEHYRNGLLHMDQTDMEGNLKPAIIADYGTKFEFYLNGRQVDPEVMNAQ